MSYVFLAPFMNIVCRISSTSLTYTGRHFKQGNKYCREVGRHRSLCSNRCRPLYSEESRAKANSRYRTLQSGDCHQSLRSSAAYGRASRSSGHPVVLYSPICEKWALNSTDEGRTEKGDTKPLRGDAGHTLRDEISAKELFETSYKYSILWGKSQN
jgi:hypothetical protein